MSTILTILYEDQIGVDLKDFGLHNLLVQCVCDEVDGVTRWQLKRRIEGHPKKGDVGVIRALESDGRKLLDSGHLIALLDDDKIRPRMGLDLDSCRKIVADSLRGKAAGCDVVLLVENTETLLGACARLMGTPWTGGKPTPVERDRLFNRFAATTNPDLRKRLRDEVPSFGRLVNLAIAWLEMDDAHH